MKNCKCRDLGCKMKQGFSSSQVMRSKKQKKKLAKHPEKSRWDSAEPEPQGSLKGNKRCNMWQSMPKIYIEEDGEVKEFVDLDAVLSNPEYYTPSGRPLFIPGHMIPIRRFIPEEHTPEYPAWICYGKRRTGKTFFIRWWLWHFRNYYDQIFCFTETKINGFWQQYIPEEAIYEGWDEDRALDILEMQKDIIRDPKKAAQKGLTDHTGTILDDVISSKMLRNAGDDGIYAGLYTQGRHVHEMIGTNTQKATALPPKVRDNIDLVFVMRQENETEVERIWKEHMSRLNKSTARDLIELWTRCENFQTDDEFRYTLVIDTHPAKSYNERFYWAVAEDPGPFKLGSKVFWETMTPGIKKQ